MINNKKISKRSKQWDGKSIEIQHQVEKRLGFGLGLGLREVENMEQGTVNGQEGKEISDKKQKSDKNI